MMVFEGIIYFWRLFGLRHLFQNLNLFLKPIAQFHASAFGVVVGLNTGPEFDGGAEIAGKTKGCIRADSGFFITDLADPHNGHIDVRSQSVLGKAHGLKKFLSKDFTRMNGEEISHEYTLVVVNDFAMLSAVATPFKTDAPLFVDSN